MALVVVSLVVTIVTALGLLRLSEKNFSQTITEAAGASSKYRGTDDLIQEIARIICIKEQHVMCEIQAVAENGEILTQIPTVPNNDNNILTLSFLFKQLQFSPPILIRIKLQPSLNVWVLWFVVGLLFGLLIFVVGTLVIAQNRKIRLTLELEKAELELQKKEAQASLGALASQVSHDIKSPLSALDMVTSDLSGLPEDKRVLLRSAVGRVKDIANNLLQKNREIMKSNSGTTAIKIEKSQDDKSSQLLSSLIESIISEKRFQFQAKPGIEIISTINADSLGLFASVQATEFKRLISNLLNNAIEILGDIGKVEVSLAIKESQVELRVKDNGKGIPPEILKKLGQRGETHGKAEGSGLGLYHARTSVESWGGSLKLESEVGKGTSVIINLPKALAPTWFVPELKFSNGLTIAVMDDDSSVKEIWRQRFEQMKFQEHQLDVHFFSNPDELETWFKASDKSKEAMFLLDYEIIGNKRTGLDVAEQLAISSKAILVSSRWEEKPVQDRCAKLGIRLIPKGLAGFVPVSIRKPLEKLDAVLLDDDSMIINTWSSVARQHNKKLRAYYEPTEFFNALGDLDLSTPVYVDSNLRDGVKGQDLIPKIKALGFKEVYLATGYQPEEFKTIPGLTAIVGKNPPKIIGGWGDDDV